MLIYLLVLVAFAGGWHLARWAGARHSIARAHAFSSDYFKGLNYLLNEEQDKAIEIFLRLVEYNHDTIETHLALGNLFRRRGEVDRAIRLHQHLVSRPDLTEAMKSLALLELGEDYMRAGLLDRAEALFSDLVAMNVHAPSALRHLIAIYQQEREWNKAIDHARRLESMTNEDTSTIIAQFYCELAQQSRQEGAYVQEQGYLEQAFGYQSQCMRAYMLNGGLCSDQGRLSEAIDAYEQAIYADMAFVPEILPLLLDVYTRSGQKEKAERFLRGILTRYRGITPVLALTEIYHKRHGKQQAIEFLASQLRQRPSVRGLIPLIDATMDHVQGQVRDHLMILRNLMEKLLEEQMMYRCKLCGFGARAHHWQCPGCRNWDTVQPIYDLASL